MGKFIIFLPMWNDMDWIEACLKQVKYWNPTHLYLMSGCWDSRFPADSTDGTTEYLKEWAKNRKNTWMVDPIRYADYRTNQANQCRWTTQLAEAKSGDWVMYQACDFYMLKRHIDIYKQLMQQSDWHYPIFEIMNFWDSATLYYSKWAEMALNLPWRLTKGYGWKPICHLAKDGILYNDHPQIVSKRMKVKGFHYEGFREKSRLKDKYAVGNRTDRESPVTWKGGIKLRNRSVYNGPHPEFVTEVLSRKGFNINQGETMAPDKYLALVRKTIKGKVKDVFKASPKDKFEELEGTTDLVYIKGILEYAEHKRNTIRAYLRLVKRNKHIGLVIPLCNNFPNRPYLRQVMTELGVKTVDLTLENNVMVYVGQKI